MLTIPNSPSKQNGLNKDFGFIGSNVPDSYIDVNVIDQTNDEMIYAESPILVPRRDSKTLERNESAQPQFQMQATPEKGISTQGSGIRSSIGLLLPGA